MRKSYDIYLSLKYGRQGGIKVNGLESVPEGVVVVCPEAKHSTLKILLSCPVINGAT